MTPTVRPPGARTRGHRPIAETLPPPDTSVQPRSAMASPTRRPAPAVRDDAGWRRNRRTPPNCRDLVGAQPKPNPRALKPNRVGGYATHIRATRIRLAPGTSTRAGPRGRDPLEDRLGGVALLGSEGVGKSTLAAQAAETWASASRCGSSAPWRGPPYRSGRSAHCWTSGRPASPPRC